MKKTILFVLMIVFLSTNLYAEEFHYHEEMWCLKPDGTPKGETTIIDGVTYIDVPGGAGSNSSDEIINKPLKEVYAEMAGYEYSQFPSTIPSKKIEYSFYDGALTVEVEPLSENQVLIIYNENEAPTRNPVLLTYYPDKRVTRKTHCIELP